jgi:hypothetical protein
MVSVGGIERNKTHRAGESGSQFIALVTSVIRKRQGVSNIPH